MQEAPGAMADIVQEGMQGLNARLSIDETCGISIDETRHAGTMWSS